jgi:drug/metabolite transporter (DMT)-like permease
VSLFSIVAGTLYHNRYCRNVPLLPANCLQLGAGAVFCWLLVAAFETPRVEPSWAAVLSFAYLTFAVSLGAMAILLFMFRRQTAGRAIANLYLTPGVAALLGWALLDERFAPEALAGFLVSMLGLWLVQRRTPPPAR